MFCKNCGKDIGDAKFCQYCGSSNDSSPNVTVNLVQNDLFTTVKDKINQIGQEKLIKFTSLIATIINIIIRVVNNTIKVVYGVVLTSDDYYVVSKSGRNYMLLVMALQIIAVLYLHSNAKKEKKSISKGTMVLFAILLIIQVLAMILEIPAPY